MKTNLEYTHTNLKLKYNVIERLGCIVEQLNKNVDRIQKFPIDDDQQFQKLMKSALENVLEDLKIETRDLHYHLTYDKVIGDI